MVVVWARAARHSASEEASQDLLQIEAATSVGSLLSLRPSHVMRGAFSVALESAQNRFSFRTAELRGTGNRNGISVSWQKIHPRQPVDMWGCVCKSADEWDTDGFDATERDGSLCMCARECLI